MLSCPCMKPASDMCLNIPEPDCHGLLCCSFLMCHKMSLCAVVRKKNQLSKKLRSRLQLCCPCQWHQQEHLWHSCLCQLHFLNFTALLLMVHCSRLTGPPLAFSLNVKRQSVQPKQAMIYLICHLSYGQFQHGQWFWQPKQWKWASDPWRRLSQWTWTLLILFNYILFGLRCLFNVTLPY